MTHYVFPNADYSRFSHSLGVCHIAGRVLETIRAKHPAKVSEDDVQRYRLAALCHDIGHYPFSHAMEDALTGHYSRRLFATEATDEPADVSPLAAVDHEAAGKRVLTHDPELLRIRGREYWLSAAQVFNREDARQEYDKLANVVSSDLDADRIDYLMRTSLHTGLPYGSVDIEYLLRQANLDADGWVCFSEKAMRAAEHLLICRYFDYQQVSYNRTVVGLEWVLKVVLGELLHLDLLRGSADGIERMIDAGEPWYRFDDGHVMEEVRELARRHSAGSETRRFCEAVLHRSPPKMVGRIEAIGERGGQAKQDLDRKLRAVEAALPGWADQLGISQRCWHVWQRTPSMTKMAASGGPGAGGAENEKALRILEATDHPSTPIMAIPRSLMSVLADQTLYALRVYVLLPQDASVTKEQVKDMVQADKQLGWV